MAVVTLVLLVAALSGSSLVAAACPKTSAVESLDIQKLEGKWYEYSSFGTLFIHGLDRCQTTTITVGSDGKSFTMSNDRIARLINTHIKTNWTVESSGDKLTGDLTLKFKLPLLGSVSVPLKVLATDYNNYVILHVCRSFSVFKFNVGFILTRKRTYSATELETLYSSIDDVLKKNSLERKKFSLSIQRDCGDDSSSASNTDTATSADKPATAPATSADTPVTQSASGTSASVESEQTSTHGAEKTTDGTTETSASGTEKTAAAESSATPSNEVATEHADTTGASEAAKSSDDTAAKPS